MSRRKRTSFYSFKDYEFSAIKLVSEICTLVKTIQANKVELRILYSDIFEAFSDLSLHEDFRLHLKFFEMRHDDGETMNIQDMLTSLDRKYCNLVKSKKWDKLVTSSIDSRYMSLLATNISPPDQDKQLLMIYE